MSKRLLTNSTATGHGQPYKNGSPPDPSINHNIACGAPHDGSATCSSTTVLSTNGYQAVPFCGYTENRAPESAFFAIIENVERCARPDRVQCVTSTSTLKIARSATSGAYFLLFWPSSVINLIISAKANGINGAEQLSEAKLVERLKGMFNVDGQPRIYIILDTVDACPTTPSIPSSREKVMNLMEDLVNSHFPNLHILVTSRPEHDIRTVLESLTSCQISLHDQVRRKGDIDNYVRFIVHSDRMMRRWRVEDKELVIRTLYGVLPTGHAASLLPSKYLAHPR